MCPVPRPIPVILCADDYGLTPGVGIGIRHLIAHGRLTATGCMTVSPHWPAEAARLGPLADRADIGLHFTLTDHVPLGAMPKLAPGRRLPPLGRIMMRAFLGQLDLGEIAAELRRQLDRFEAEMGRQPDFIDGHHHVHQLPTVRAALVQVMVERLFPGRVYVRSCHEPLAALRRLGVAGKRAAVISLIGQGWTRRARALGIAGNTGFRGVRDFTEPSYAALFPRYLSDARPGMLIMCHPGQVDDALRAVDSVTDARADELAYLDSDNFTADLAAAGVVLARGSDAL